MIKYVFTLVFTVCISFIYAQKFEDLAQTPPMGWNSWNKFNCNVSEQLIKETADAMVSSGMKAVGYQYIVIDDCWQIERDPNGKIVADPERFPSGIKALVDYVHGKGLKFGIYSCAGTKTCQERPGSHGKELIDAKTYADWGVDYLKYDWCFTDGIEPISAYTTMSEAIREAGRPMVFSICEWGLSKPWTWAATVGHLWRTTYDIRDWYDGEIEGNFLGWSIILDKQVGLERYSGPGHWNDPDMLEVGNGRQTNTEYQAHFSFWALLNAPLIAGNDLRNMDARTIEILTNKEVIAVNQDRLGKQGYKIFDSGDTEVWCKNLYNGDYCIILFNRASGSQQVAVQWEMIAPELATSSYMVRDLWKHKNLGYFKYGFNAVIPSHGAKMIRLTGMDKGKVNLTP
ncbi:glycoside hydrolase family 27 protein [Aestuariivivens sediminis]|uniref:glycoside hydrolase family 27 protein n=1 Tax=Aestuariivivens sediminis TaxID=2913557 RepID=UPI001F55B8C4|nr:glycoside hydrolase family 27 protein [Aestuariivivens sediminis]